MARLIFLISLLLFLISSLFAQETTPKAAVTQSVANSALLRADGNINPGQWCCGSKHNHHFSRRSGRHRSRYSRNYCLSRSSPDS